MNDTNRLEPPKDTRSYWQLVKSHPVGFWFIFWGELAERCSYYGMNSILARFLAEKLDLGEGASGTYTSLFKAGCYFFPLLGGFLADQYLGKYRLIVMFSIPYIIGHIVLGAETLPMTMIALVLLALGSGAIKPNISTLMGMTYDQKRPGDEKLRSMAFEMFYMAINIGSAISYATIPWIRTEFGYGMAFLCPAVLMAISFVIFALGKKHYAVETIATHKKSPAEKAEQWLVIRRIAPLFLLVMVFWAIFDQSHNTWVFFANTYMDRTLFGYQIDPETFGTINPLLIVLFVPLMRIMWNWLETKGIKFRPTDKMILGFVLTGLTMAVMAYAGYTAGAGETQTIAENGKEVSRVIVPAAEKVTIWWQVLAFVLITAAEILISVTGLELAFVVSPQSMKGFITALWLLTVGMANLFINASVTRLYPEMNKGQYFAMLAAGAFVVAFLCVFIARGFNDVKVPDALPEAPESPGE
jgi:POT family proton-dependent oligopeptide transporter